MPLPTLITGQWGLHADIAHQSLMCGPLTHGPHVRPKDCRAPMVVCLELLGAQSAVAAPRAGAVHCAAEDLAPVLVVTSSVPGLPLSLGPPFSDRVLPCHSTFVQGGSKPTHQSRRRSATRNIRSARHRRARPTVDPPSSQSPASAVALSMSLRPMRTWAEARSAASTTRNGVSTEASTCRSRLDT